MNLRALIERLERSAASIDAAARCVGADDRWRPESGEWSVLEIVNHLADEEVEDFRARLSSTLADPARPWPPIDPVSAARERAYNERDLDESLGRFRRERAESLSWLRSLETPAWESAHAHPTLGVLRAGDLLAAWCAHDTLHLRQIARRLYQLTIRDTAQFDVSYAGAW